MGSLDPDEDPAGLHNLSVGSVGLVDPSQNSHLVDNLDPVGSGYPIFRTGFDSVAWSLGRVYWGMHSPVDSTEEGEMPPGFPGPDKPGSG